MDWLTLLQVDYNQSGGLDKGEMMVLVNRMYKIAKRPILPVDVGSVVDFEVHYM